MAETFLSQTSLSADGINVINLSGTDAAIAYNPVSPLNGVLVTLTTPGGSTVFIDTAYVGSNLLVLSTPLDAGGFTAFTLLSGGGINLLGPDFFVWTDRQRRLRWLGYI